MGDPAVSQEVRHGVRDRGKHLQLLKSPQFTSETRTDEEKTVKCFNDVQPSSTENQHVTSGLPSQVEKLEGILYSRKSCTTAALTEKGTSSGLAHSVAATTLSYFTLAENHTNSSFYVLGACEAQGSIASSPSVFLWNPSEACIHEVDTGLGNCRRIFRLPVGAPFTAGVGGCCCISSSTVLSRQRGNRRRQGVKMRKKNYKLKQEGNKHDVVPDALLPSYSTLTQADSKSSSEDIQASLSLEETKPSQRLFLLAEDCTLRQFSSSVALRAESQIEGKQEVRGHNKAQRQEGPGVNGTMEETLSETKALSLAGVIYAVYALPSSSAWWTPSEISPSLCLVVHAPFVPEEDRPHQEQQQPKRKLPVDLQELGQTKQQKQKPIALTAEQQRQQLRELHFAVVCCTSLKVLSTCMLPFPITSCCAAAEAARDPDKTTECNVALATKERECFQTEKEATAVEGLHIEKIYVTGTVADTPQQQNVISLQVIVHIGTEFSTRKSAFHGSRKGETPGELTASNCYAEEGKERLHLDMCLQAALEVTVMNGDHKENRQQRTAAVSGASAVGTAAACAGVEATARVRVNCRSSFRPLGEPLYSEEATDGDAGSDCREDKRRRLSGDTSNGSSTSSNYNGADNHSRSIWKGRRRFVTCFPDWSPLSSASTTVFDMFRLPPLVMLSQQHTGEHQLFSVETSTAELLLAKRFRSLLFPERHCYLRGATLLSRRYFIEWIRGDMTETGCLLLLREMMWGAPCSPVYRVDCSRYFEVPPVLLGCTSYRQAPAATVDLLWRGIGAVFCIPLLRPVLSQRRILGACAGFPLSQRAAAGQCSAAAALLRQKMKEDHALLLHAAGLDKEERVAEVAAALLAAATPRPGQLQQWKLPFEEAWTSSDHEYRETEEAICSVVKEGVAAIPLALISYIIEHAMVHAAVQCCKSPLIQEAGVIRLLLWRPTYFLPLILGGQLSFSKSLLLQSLQQALTTSEGQAAPALLEMLQLLSAWLKHYCNSQEAPWPAEQQKKDGQGTASSASAEKIKSTYYTATPSAPREGCEHHQKKVPPLEVVLDFIGILVGARLPDMVMGSDFPRDVASLRRLQEEKVFLRVLRRVQQLLEAVDGKALRRVEGRIFAALSAQVNAAECGGANRDLVETFKVPL